jgi:hypothetical protein
MKKLTTLLKTLKVLQTILACIVVIGAFILGDSLDLQEKISALLKKFIRSKR